MGTKVTSAGHDSLFAEGSAEEVRIETFDIKTHGRVGLGADHVDFGFVAEEFVELARTRE